MSAAEKNGGQPKPETPFDAFKELTRKLVRVPKREADAKEAAYQKKKARKKQKPA